MTHRSPSISPTRPGPRRARSLAAVAAVAAVAAGSLAACGSSVKSSSGGGGGGDSIQMWVAGNSTTKPIYTAEAAAYSKTHNVSVSLTDLPGPAYTQKLDAALAAGKPPAIYQLFSPGPQMKTLVAGHHLADLSSLVSGPGGLKSRILPTALAQGQLDGKQYGIPYNIFQESVVIYSKPDFKKAGITGTPATWSDLMADVGKLKKAGFIPAATAGSESNNWYELWLENYEVHLAGLGVSQSLQKGDYKALDTAPVVKAATAMQQLIKTNPFEPGYTTTSESNDVPYALIGTGKAAMVLNGAYTPNFIEDVAPSFVKKGQMGWFSFPAVTAGGDDAIDLSSQPQLVVSADQSKAKISASEAFLKSFVFSTPQEHALASSGNVGPEANAADLVSKYAPKDLKSYMEFQLSEASKPKDSFLSWSQYIPTSQTDTWNSLLEKLFSLKISPQAFARQAAKM